MLEHDSFDALPSVVYCLKDLVELGAEVPAAARLREELANFGLVGDKEFSQEGCRWLSLSLQLTAPCA